MERKKVIEYSDYIENEFSEIYYELMGCDEISVYKKSLLISKANLLALKYKKFADEIIEDDKKLKRKLQLKLKLMIIFAFIECVCIFLLPIAFIIPSIVKLYLLISSKKLEREVLTEKEWDEIRKTASNVETIVTNIETFLEVKSNKRVERLQEERKNNIKEALMIDVANRWLESFFDFEIDIDDNFTITMPKEIEDILIKMLQDDLKVEEDNLVTLLKMAMANIKSNNIVEQDELKLTRSKE